MTTTLQDPRVASTLDRMYTESKNQMSRLRERGSDFNRPMTTQERTEAMSEFYIPVTPESGRLLYSLVRATRPATYPPRASRALPHQLREPLDVQIALIVADGK